MKEESILLASRYVEGDMDPEEKKAFELLLQEDARLREYTLQYRQASEALRELLAPDEDLYKLKQTLAGLNKEYFAGKEEAARVVPFRLDMRWLSGIAAVLLIGLVIFAPWRKDLYEQYHGEITMSVTERGGNRQTDLEKAESAFNKKDFATAEKWLKNEYTARPGNALGAYYYGIALLNNGKEGNGRQVLEKIYQGESVFKYNAAWQLALSYLKQNDKENCRKWLEKIPEGTTGHEQAVKLLKDL